MSIDKLQERWAIRCAAERFSVGERVAHPEEGVGHVEHVDLTFPFCVDVRWLTPRNEPSVLTSCVVDARDLTHVPESVVPMPKSAAWWREAHEFCTYIEEALRQDEQEGSYGNQ